MVRGLDGGIAEVQQFPLYAVDGVWVDAVGWQYRSAIPFLHAQDDVAAAQVVEVVGERAQRAQNPRRIPTRLVLDALALDRSLAQ